MSFFNSELGVGGILALDNNMEDKNVLNGLTRRSVLTVAAAFLAPAAFLRRALAGERIGRVAEVSGGVFAYQGTAMRGLLPRADVMLGDRVATAIDGRAGLLLAGKTTLRLGGSTSVTIDKFLANSGGVLTLGQGALSFDAPKGGFPNGLKVESPFALLAVRGTSFYAGRLGSSFSVFVETGRVDVTGGGKTVTLRKGEGVDIKRRGDAPGPVKTWGAPKIKKFKSLFA